MSQPNHNNNNFKDTKIFVGNLTWRTTTEELRNFFQREFGEVIDANVVSEGLQGGILRSKGYGFVVFRDAESANTACQRPWPVIDGRQTNVNMACIRAKNKTNQSNQNGLLNQAGPSHQYQNGLLNQAAPHQYQLASQYPYPYTPPPSWAPYYGHHPYMYSAPCYSYPTSLVSVKMHQHVLAYRTERYWQRMHPSVNVSAPPNAPIVEEEADKDTKQLGNGVEVTLPSEIEAENTSQENGNGHEEENGDQEGEEHE